MLDCRELRGVAERAFWDVLQEGLLAQPQQWMRLVTLVVDSRNQLAELIPKRSPAGQGLLADMMDKLDEVCNLSTPLQGPLPCPTICGSWLCSWLTNAPAHATYSSAGACR